MELYICVLFCIVFLAFLWLTCVFEAFDGLTGGRIRKVEEKDCALAEKLDRWLENSDSLRGILKPLLFILAFLLGMLACLAVKQLYGTDFTARWGGLVVIVVIIVISGISEMAAKLVMYRMDLLLLRSAIPLLRVLELTVFYPQSQLIKCAIRVAERWRKNETEEEKVGVEDEILSYVENYNEDTANDLEEGEKQMIRGILDLGDTTVHEIMTPRVDLIAIPASATVAEAKSAFITSGHSRIPVYGRSIDEIKGIIYAKDFISDEHLKGKTVPDLAHTPIFVPETKLVAELLEEIKRSRNHFAVIIDEYGGTSGIITFEDIIEEIVGDVQDEYDSEDELKHRPQLLPDGGILLDARTLVSDVNDIAETQIPDTDDADTIGGYICSELGRIPEEGEVFESSDKQWKASIVKADKRTIRRLKMILLEDAENE